MIKELDKYYPLADKVASHFEEVGLVLGLSLEDIKMASRKGAEEGYKTYQAKKGIKGRKEYKIEEKRGFKNIAKTIEEIESQINKSGC